MTKQVDGLFAVFNSEKKAAIPLPMVLCCHKTIRTQNEVQNSIRQQPGYGETKPNKNMSPSSDCWGMCAAEGATRVIVKSVLAPELE